MESNLTKIKKLFFILILVGGGLGIGLAISEVVLRYREQIIQKSNHLDPGMILYDARLGWKMTPNWQGRHRHHDFEVTYNTNRYGFRGDFEQQPPEDGKRIAVVGDSFTFCFGVDDGDTFVDYLNGRPNIKNRFLNFGVPGYSTDQEYLLIEERLPAFSVDAILLVVYLGNELFDNELPWPLQSGHAKPRFESNGDALVLSNVPVPHQTKPAEQMGVDLSRIVLGDLPASEGKVRRWLNRFHLFRMLDVHLNPLPDLATHFTGKFDGTLSLFWNIVAKTRTFCSTEKIDLALVLMPGQSFTRRPRSYSGQIQNYFRMEIMQSAAHKGVDAIDLAGLLKERYVKHPGRWYHPNEGHMTPVGQRVVANILGEEVERRWQ